MEGKYLLWLQLVNQTASTSRNWKVQIQAYAGDMWGCYCLYTTHGIVWDEESSVAGHIESGLLQNHLMVGKHLKDELHQSQTV